MSSKMHLGTPRRHRERADKLQYRFYEPLVLLWILNKNQQNTITVPSANARNEAFPQAWRTFLDAISWFGDNKHGGDTVTAVGGENQQPGVTYWVCARRESSHRRISEVLQLLESTAVSDATRARWRNAEEHLIHESIEFAKDKVEHYRRELAYRLDQAPTDMETPADEYQNLGAGDGVHEDDGGESSLFSAGKGNITPLGHLSISTELQGMVQEIERLVSRNTSRLELCTSAYSFAHQTQLNNLVQKTERPTTASPWRSIRHYLFRLGAWHRKARVLVDFAQDHSDFLDAHSCRHLPLPTRQSNYPPADQDTELESALKRMLPAGQDARAESLFNQLISLRTFDLSTAFVEAWSNPMVQLSVHAEVHLLEHFYFRRLSYTLQDKYIGCSKPTCYCCSLYQRYHPANVVLRRSHGNAWPKWYPPLLSGDISPTDTAQHNLAVMNAVIAHIRRDVIDEIDRRMPRRTDVPDSSSGIYSRPTSVT